MALPLIFTFLTANISATPQIKRKTGNAISYYNTRLNVISCPVPSVLPSLPLAYVSSLGSEHEEPAFSPDRALRCRPPQLSGRRAGLCRAAWYSPRGKIEACTKAAKYLYLKEKGGRLTAQASASRQPSTPPHTHLPAEEFFKTQN